MAPNILKNEEYIVLFVDILGSKEMIKNDPDGFLNIFNDIFTKQYEILINLQPINDNIKIKIFSDNLVVYAKITNDDNNFVNVDGILHLAALIQAMMLIEAGFMVRGSIVVGKLFANDTYIIGPALVDAYENESNLAKNPEIHISTDVCNYLKNLYNKYGAYSINTVFHLKEEKDHFFLDYLRYYEHIFVFYEQDSKKLFNPIIGHKLSFERMYYDIYSKLDPDTKKKIKSKYHWVANYHDEFCNVLNCLDLKIKEEILNDLSELN